MKLSKKLTTTVIKRLTPHYANLTSRSMFGGYGLCQKGVMFALINDEKLYLRADTQSEALYQEKEMSQFFYRNRSYPIGLNYYHVHNSIWEDEVILLHLIKVTIDAAHRDNKIKTNTQSNRLKNLPNISLNLERLLIMAGISDQLMLKELGAVNAYIKLRRIKSDISTEQFFALAGAIKGQHIAIVKQQQQDDLLKQLKRQSN